MINFLFRIMLSFSATSWMIVVYVIKIHYSLFSLPASITALILVAVTVGLAALILLLTKSLEKDEVVDCTTFDLADDTYLPIYLGYFFVALSINDCFTLGFVYAIVLVLTTLLNAYFNPVFILFGYHYYKVTSSGGTQLFLICRSSERNPDNVKLYDLRRINNRTYIAHGGKS